MSVEGCYTDFHIDFGGTSVWYHILRGTKVGPRDPSDAAVTAGRFQSQQTESLSPKSFLCLCL